MSNEKSERIPTKSLNNFTNKNVPTVLIKALNTFLSNKDQGSWATTCSMFNNLTKADRILARFTFIVLKYVATGNQDEAQKILLQYPALAAKRGVITDWAGRTFNCSPFEYAVWALDVRYMCPMMLDCLPNNEQGERLRIKLQNQKKSIQANGLRYTLNNIVYQEIHFSFIPLKLTLRTSRGHNHWKTKVGQEEALLPVHVRQHYCDPDESFATKPKFTKAQFKRTLVFYNKTLNQNQVWDNTLVGLGVEFAILGATQEGHSHVSRTLMADDYAVISMLEKTRVEIDLPLLDKRLDTPLADFSNAQALKQ